jgi:hypothetical protein
MSMGQYIICIYCDWLIAHAREIPLVNYDLHTQFAKKKIAQFLELTSRYSHGILQACAEWYQKQPVYSVLLLQVMRDIMPF